MTKKLMEKPTRSNGLPNALAGERKKPLEDKLDEKGLRRIRELLRGEGVRAVVQIMYDSTDNVKYVAKFLSDNNARVRGNAAWALRIAANNRIDIPTVIPNLGNALGDEDNDVRWHAAEALVYAARNGNEVTRALITKAVMDFLESRWFMTQADRNSRIYIEVITKLDEIMRTVGEAERKKATA